MFFFNPLTIPSFFVLRQLLSPPFFLVWPLLYVQKRTFYVPFLVSEILWWHSAFQKTKCQFEFSFVPRNLVNPYNKMIKCFKLSNAHSHSVYVSVLNIFSFNFFLPHFVFCIIFLAFELTSFFK